MTRSMGQSYPLRATSQGELSAARVILTMDASKVLAIDVRIDLRRRDVRMPKHFLDRSQIGASLEQMGRKRMAERVRRHVLVDAGALDVFAQDLPRPHARQRLSARVEEHHPFP